MSAESDPGLSIELPGKPESCWIACAPETAYPRLQKSIDTEVAIVGAGIVGLSAAYVLARAGIPVTVLEARKIGRQVTGRSTAKITSQHALIYAYLIRKFGFDLAQLYADANQTAVAQICRWIGEARIDCDLQRKDAYAYASKATRRASIEAEARAARSLGLQAEALRSAPLPFATAGALRFPDQAQFNPVQYLVGLAAGVEAAGGRIFEDSRVASVKRRKRWRVTVGEQNVDAQHVVLATNLPIAGPIEFDEMTQPRCHIAMAFRADAGSSLDGMFIGIDQPTHSLRMGRDTEGPLLVVLGPKFKTGQEGDVARRFRELEKWVRANVPAGDVAWHWVNEDYDSPDRVPFVGEETPKARGLYVATGFNAWGISNGTAAGMTIADQIQGRANPWTALYDPTRKMPRHFNKGGDSKSQVKDLANIRPGEGGVIKRGKDKLAVFKSLDGKTHALSASCTHKGCTVTWNNAVGGWDCPCHGSMFSCDGQVLHGPATKPLPSKKLAAGHK